MRYIMHGESAVEPEIESESSSPQNPTEPTEIKKVIITGLVKRTASAGEQRPAAAEHLLANLEKSCIVSPSSPSSPLTASPPPRIASPIFSPRLALKRTHSAGEQRPAAAEHVPASSEKSSIASPSPRLPVSPITSPRLTVDKSYADPRIQITIRNMRTSQSLPQRSPDDMTQAIAGEEKNVGRPIAAFKPIRSFGRSNSLPVRKFLEKSVFDMG